MTADAFCRPPAAELTPTPKQLTSESPRPRSPVTGGTEIGKVTGSPLDVSRVLIVYT
jgi:hypothetical protein